MFKLSPVALGISLALAAVAVHAQDSTGPQSSQTPYIVPTAPGWEVVSLLTVGDSAKNVDYRMVGIPDGMGALPGKFAANGGYVADKAYMTFFLNHELGATSGVTRAHGATGAFVSQWTMHLNSKQIMAGEDLITQVKDWDNLNKQFVDATGATQFGRFCSADLPAKTAFHNPATGRGFDGLIFMKGEEAGNEGRAYATIVSGDEKGTSYQLPSLGRFSWENSVAHPNAGDKTLVVGLDDSSPGQVYLYVGDKQRSGNPVEQAGLQNGKLYGIRVNNGGDGYGNGLVKLEAGAINGSFDLVDMSDIVALDSGAQLQTQSTARDVTEWARPEDGHWDTQNPNVFYWATTGRSGATARLYKFSFDSVANPTGGTVEMVLDSASLVGTDGQAARSFDNMTVDGDGNIIIQEDPGNSAYIAKVWKFNPASKQAVQIFESDRSRFLSGAPGFLTQDEENSGVIDVTDIVANANWYESGRRYYLGNMQAHYGLPGELVQGGQVYLMASPKVGDAGKGRK
ncbi:alkaline phosphatase PhoX [Thiobacillus denitrificans]|uniref:alkaline phosphatase PhoX n=1 Tax=Thiobacillus denitrificans TaxID=36861 RepID=UPI00037DA80C|nr:alkaline phosphatase PhoX [Thiobacillus denitrificans]